MAKVKAPLFGLGASGQLGKALVFFGWKGLDLVREHVVPANPNTAAQSTQRGYMTAAGAAWHTVGTPALQAEDITAWNRLATTLGPMSGFNAFCKYWIEELVAGGTPIGHFYDVNFTDPTAGAMDVDVDVDNGAAEVVTMTWGTTPTAMYSAATQAMVAGNAAFAGVPSGFAAGTLIYFWFSVGGAGVDYSRSGIYTQVLT